MSISKKRASEIKAIREEEIDRREIDELGEPFFTNAALTRPGESVIDTVQRGFARNPDANDPSDP